MFTPIRKIVTVKASPEQAFHRFTAEMASWWPLASHSVGQGEAEGVTMEGRVGGRIVERIRGGRESVWGTVTAWDPPRRVAFTWHPGRDPAIAQDIEVRFTAAAGRTRVELEHAGFERLGPLARKARRGYPIGWAYVLGLYAGRRGPLMALARGLGALLLARRRRSVEPVREGVPSARCGTAHRGAA
ncbi:MAG: hypothetical protein A2W00_13130 [Candidatus Eisenbacteria bacterium RBG_16_71_46]|nr:MAG: hypothetical protein A2W00_13130 [Candidatus Eisenbacteria bacterium RBG_16_71_46]